MAAQFHFWEYINRNLTFLLDSHRPFICIKMMTTFADAMFLQCRLWSSNKNLFSFFSPNQLSKHFIKSLVFYKCTYCSKETLENLVLTDNVDSRCGLQILKKDNIWKLETFKELLSLFQELHARYVEFFYINNVVLICN